VVDVRRPTVRQVEPAIAVVLGLHGLAIVGFGWAPGWTAVAFLAVVATGVAGVVGWSSRRAQLLRALVLALTALGLSIAEPGLVPNLLQWYYCVAAIYPLLMAGRGSWAVGPLTGFCYLVQVAAGAAPVPAGVAALRAGVLTALGLATWSAGMALRASTDEAERGRLLAERAGQRLKHAATHDDLTGLASRSLLSRAVARALQDGRPAALLLLDLDRFKEVNDTLGHRYGDLLLQQVAARLQGAVGVGPIVARLGGDEFAVLLADADEAAGRRHAQRLRESLQEPFLLQEAAVAVDASVGIAVAPRDGDDGDVLLQHADVAMYEAKATGSGLAVYSPDLDRHSADNLALLAELRGSITRGELVVEYQPKVRSSDGAPVAMEALVRWEHPVRGRLAPDLFIPLAERSGFIHSLTAFVLSTALRECRAWRDAGLQVGVSVNVSARNLTDEALPDLVWAELERSGVPPQWLELEITESALMGDLVRAQQRLMELHALGLRLAIDDFGTGMSSLSYLRDLPVDVLKIDRSFVTDMLEDPTATAIVQAVVDLGSSLGLDTVAEGVEDRATLSRLSAMGCAHAQGYVISRPLAAAAVMPWCLARSDEREERGA
jgi:diguanylate cyclase (GGDEF)-like protein